MPYLLNRIFCFFSLLEWMVQMGFSRSDIHDSLTKQRFNNITATYILLGQRRQKSLPWPPTLSGIIQPRSLIAEGTTTNGSSSSTSNGRQSNSQARQQQLTSTTTSTAASFRRPFHNTNSSSSAASNAPDNTSTASRKYSNAEGSSTHYGSDGFRKTSAPATSTGM